MTSAKLRVLVRLFLAFVHSLTDHPDSTSAAPQTSKIAHLMNAAKSADLEQARRDRRPVATRTINQQRTILRQFFQIFLQMIERHAQTSEDILLIALPRRANINSQRRLGR